MDATAEPIDPEEAYLDESRMAFLEHLADLRACMRNSVIALAVSFLVAFTFSEDVFVWMCQPLARAWDSLASANILGERAIYFTSLVEPFFVYLSVALWTGFFIASPVIFYQLWKFIAPGLYSKERKYGLAFAGASAISFLLGALFCYYAVLPHLYEFLLSSATKNLGEIAHSFGKTTLEEAVGLAPLLGMSEYLEFAQKMLLGFGLIFELPLLMFFLALSGAVSYKGFWRFGRWAILICFIISAILTPPDVVSQLSMALPMIVMYQVGVLAAFLVQRRQDTNAPESDPAD